MWWADDAIQCLEKVLAAPPAQLGDLLREHGINIWVQSSDGEVIGDAQAHVDWLRHTAVRMREMFESYVASKSAEVTAARPVSES